MTFAFLYPGRWFRWTEALTKAMGVIPPLEPLERREHNRLLLLLARGATIVRWGLKSSPDKTWFVELLADLSYLGSNQPRRRISSQWFILSNYPWVFICSLNLCLFYSFERRLYDAIRFCNLKSFEVILPVRLSVLFSVPDVSLKSWPERLLSVTFLKV